SRVDTGFRCAALQMTEAGGPEAIKQKSSTRPRNAPLAPQGYGKTMIFLYGIALLAGIATAVQPGQSTQLARSFGGEPFAAGLVSMLV
ncbi:hypothetical protein DD647_28995, partial [Escherichia coli]